MLHKNRRWCEAGDALLHAMDKLSFPDMWDEVIGEREQIFRTMTSKAVAELVTSHLTKTLGFTSRPTATEQNTVAA